jgi:recombination protein RecR
MIDQFPILNDVAVHLSKLPGIGQKTALRHALWFVEHKSEAKSFADSLYKVADNIKLCKKCRNVTTNSDEICNICKDSSRDKSTICVVESLENFLAIESSSVYNGTYYILGGLVSPLYGIDSYSLGLDYLIDRVVNEHIQEVVLVVSSTLEGDLTTQYIKNGLKDKDVKIAKIASGIPVGANVNLVDKNTLIEAFKSRHSI